SKEKLRNKLWSRLIKKGSNADEPASIDFSESNSSSGDSDRHATPVRLRKKKTLRSTRKKVGVSRSSVAQVVDKVTTQMRMDKTERRSKTLQHSRSGSSGSPVTSCREPLVGDRVSGRLCSEATSGDSLLHDTVYKPPLDTKPCLKKLLERIPVSSSALDLSSGRTSLKPTQYKLEEALPTPCSAPPLRRSSHSLIRPPLQSSSATRECSSSSPAPSEKLTTGSVNESLAHRRNNNRHRDATNNDMCDIDSLDPHEPRGYLDGATKSYMERMGELMASRLAISDTEEGSVSNFWEADPPSRLLLPTPSVRRLEALEPVVAKTRLHDPRRPARTTRPTPTMYSSVRTAHVIHRGTAHLHRVPFTRRDKHNDQIKNKRRDKDEEKSFQYLQDDRMKENGHLQNYDSRSVYNGYDNNNLIWVRKPNGDTLDYLTDSLSNANFSYHRYSSQPCQLDMGPCEDLLVSGEEVVLRLSVPPTPKMVVTARPWEETSGSLASRKGSTTRHSRRGSTTKVSTTRDMDEEQLCADIATCDTLFLDTSAQETPELIAARNLKGKVKKKKSVKTRGGSGETEKRKDDKESESNYKVTQDEDSEKLFKVDDGHGKEVSESTPSEGKIKKKIKIVIGKKSKTKVSKKNLQEKYS
ncbi:putative cytosolic carboxypeptidase NnaD-like, partial [Homarus americanus]